MVKRSLILDKFDFAPGNDQTRCGWCALGQSNDYQWYSFKDTRDDNVYCHLCASTYDKTDEWRSKGACKIKRYRLLVKEREQEAIEEARIPTGEEELRLEPISDLPSAQELIAYNRRFKGHLKKVVASPAEKARLLRKVAKLIKLIHQETAAPAAGDDDATIAPRGVPVSGRSSEKKPDQEEGGSATPSPSAKKSPKKKKSVPTSTYVIFSRPATTSAISWLCSGLYAGKTKSLDARVSKHRGFIREPETFVRRNPTRLRAVNKYRFFNEITEHGQDVCLLPLVKDLNQFSANLVESLAILALHEIYGFEMNDTSGQLYDVGSAEVVERLKKEKPEELQAMGLALLLNAHPFLASAEPLVKGKAGQGPPLPPKLYTLAKMDIVANEGKRGADIAEKTKQAQEKKLIAALVEAQRLLAGGAPSATPSAKDSAATSATETPSEEGESSKTAPAIGKDSAPIAPRGVPVSGGGRASKKPDQEEEGGSTTPSPSAKEGESSKVSPSDKEEEALTPSAAVAASATTTTCKEGESSKTAPPTKKKGKERQKPDGMEKSRQLMYNFIRKGKSKSELNADGSPSKNGSPEKAADQEKKPYDVDSDDEWEEEQQQIGRGGQKRTRKLVEKNLCKKKKVRS